MVSLYPRWVQTNWPHHQIRPEMGQATGPQGACWLDIGLGGKGGMVGRC
jgi:hypothetical protein